MSNNIIFSNNLFIIILIILLSYTIYLLNIKIHNNENFNNNALNTSKTFNNIKYILDDKLGNKLNNNLINNLSYGQDNENNNKLINESNRRSSYNLINNLSYGQDNENNNKLINESNRGLSYNTDNITNNRISNKINEINKRLSYNTNVITSKDINNYTNNNLIEMIQHGGYNESVKSIINKMNNNEKDELKRKLNSIKKNIRDDYIEYNMKNVLNNLNTNNLSQEDFNIIEQQFQTRFNSSKKNVDVGDNTIPEQLRQSKKINNINNNKINNNKINNNIRNNNVENFNNVRHGVNTIKSKVDNKPIRYKQELLPKPPNVNTTLTGGNDNPVGVNSNNNYYELEPYMILQKNDPIDPKFKPYIENKRPTNSTTDLLPDKYNVNKSWFQVPNENFDLLKAVDLELPEVKIGIDTVGQSRKNATYDLRAAPPNPKFAVSPWNNSTIEPDYNTKPWC
jgi:hypothetical protein